MQNDPTILEDGLVVSYKTEHTLTIWSSNCTPWYLLKELKTYVHTKTCTQMFTAALFIIAKTWKQPRCPSVNKLVHSDKGYYSVLKRKRLSNHEKTWRKLKCILVSERSQSEKGYIHIAWFPLYNIWKRQTSGDSKKISGCQGFCGAERRKKDKSVEHRGFLEQQKYSVWYYMYNTLYDTVMMDTCH